jgi:uncharacterized protein
MITSKFLKSRVVHELARSEKNEATSAVESKRQTSYGNGHRIEIFFTDSWTNSRGSWSTSTMHPRSFIRGVALYSLTLSFIADCPSISLAFLVPIDSFLPLLRSSKLPIRLASTVVSDTVPDIVYPIVSATRDRVWELQQASSSVVRSYDVTQEPFDPVPWLRNHHVQTVGGYVFRKLQPDLAFVSKDEAWFQTVGRMMKAISLSAVVATSNGNEESFWHRRDRIETPDQDWFHVDIKYAKKESTSHSKSIVLLLHGLQSNSQSPICKEMATAFLDHHGMDECHCLNFRGCSGTPNDKVGGYQLGFTDDLQQYLSLFRERYRDEDSSGPPPSLYLAGFSLGANVVLKCLGELGPAAVDQYHIAGAAVVCAPLDQVANAPVLAQPGINRLIYTQNLLQSLQKKCQEQYEQFYGNATGSLGKPVFNYTKAMSAQTITEFDDAFIAPVYNFTDCWDYYQQTSSIHCLQNITVPTLMLNAQDDPFFDNTIWPDHWSVENGGTVPIKMVHTPYGGHLGYYFHRQVVPLHGPSGSDPPIVVPSWSILELGRFLSHVKESSSPLYSSDCPSE